MCHPVFSHQLYEVVAAPAVFCWHYYENFEKGIPQTKHSSQFGEGVVGVALVDHVGRHYYVWTQPLGLHLLAPPLKTAALPVDLGPVNQGAGDVDVGQDAGGGVGFTLRNQRIIPLKLHIHQLQLLQLLLVVTNHYLFKSRQHAGLLFRFFEVTIVPH